MVHGGAREGKWRGNWRMECVASTLHTTSEHGVSSITTADAHTSAASSRLNWRPRRFKWTCPFRRKTKSCFCACAITFQTQSTQLPPPYNWDFRSSGFLGLLDPWKSEKWAFPKCRQPATNLRCLTSQKSKGLSMLLINASDLPLWDARLQLARDTTISKWHDGISNLVTDVSFNVVSNPLLTQTRR